MNLPTHTPVVWDAVSLRITNPAEVETQLETAVHTLLPAAAARNCGILVLRHGPGQYTAQVTQDVPSGLIREETTWDRARSAGISNGKILPVPSGSVGASAGTRNTVIA